MAKRCSVCSHPSQAVIDRGLLAAVPYRTLAGEFNLSLSALSRHKKHLAGRLVLDRRRQDQAHQVALLERLELLSTRLDRLFSFAADDHSLHVALGCLRESLRLLSLLERCRHSPVSQA